MLIDKNGKIAFKGHPAERESIEKDLDTLARGEELTGKGTAASTQETEAPSEEEKPAGNELEIEQVNSEIAAGKEAMLGMQADPALSTAAKGMARSFCVLVFEQEFNPVTGKTKSEFTNHRVLVGKQESIDLLKSAMEERVKGCFQLRLNERAL